MTFSLGGKQTWNQLEKYLTQIGTNKNNHKWVEWSQSILTKLSPQHSPVPAPLRDAKASVANGKIPVFGSSFPSLLEWFRTKPPFPFAELVTMSQNICWFLRQIAVSEHRESSCGLQTPFSKATMLRLALQTLVRQPPILPFADSVQKPNQTTHWNYT